ncbi:hypothetical protein CBR_g810 [Chara braunii]|uniref:Integrase catalytic domain-containing protein n=1 Tax=Chara braunii TaxID=69332 RepID=A0A388KCC3_CHABU|nr:hypothetical protein CBR_g810 [Chara braunii]|eukprot:GBG67681.1 hypothetical protein CBR_g810 [Chara braunii]
MGTGRRRPPAGDPTTGGRGRGSTSAGRSRSGSSRTVATAAGRGKSESSSLPGYNGARQRRSHVPEDTSTTALSSERRTRGANRGREKQGGNSGTNGTHAVHVELAATQAAGHAADLHPPRSNISDAGTVDSTGSAVADCSPALAAQAKQLEERINSVVASLGDISTFAGTSTVSNQLQTLSDRVQQRTDATFKEWKMPNFKIEKFDDYHKTDLLQWSMAFKAEEDVHHTPPLRRLDALYLQFIGGAQAFTMHMAVTLECTIATLHTKITWEEFEKKWKTRFMVNNDKRHALNKIFPMFQGQQPSQEWLTEWQRLVATPELNLPFDAIWAEFFARSCDALTAALGSEFQYETFDEMISKARELIQGKWRAANEARQQPDYVEKGKGQRTQQLAAIQQGSSEDHAAASTSSDGDVAAAIPPQRSRPRGGKHKAKPASADGARHITSVDGQRSSYLAKIDREHSTPRYVDIDAPLLYIRIQIGKATCSALIACGASRNYISQDLMARAGLGPRVRRKSQPTHVTLADGHMQKSIDRCLDSVPVYCAPLACEAVSFDILDTKFDMILGMSWLQSKDHPVNFYRRTAHICDRRGELVPCTVPLPHPSIGCHVVSEASIRQSIRRNDIEEMGICFFLHALPPGDQPKTDTSDPWIIELLDNYEDVFQAPAGVVPDRPIRHRITLEDGVVPPRRCIYCMSEEELQVLRAQLDDLLAKGWIRPSCSPYSASVLFVRKNNKDLRLCIDYQKLNAQTIKNAGPLPRIDDLLERLGGAKYFSKLDLKSGYHQIEIQPRDRYKTTFKTWYEHFEWIVMPFGLTNAPTTFQVAMTTEFRDLLDRTVLIYLDDILVYSRSLDEHLRAVLERLRIAKYKANRDKCEFAQQELEYLGHYVTPQGIRPLADKVQAIQDWPDLVCTTDICSFLGLASYYMRFVKGFQRVAAPLSRLQSPLVPFKFNDEARHAFHTLKTTLLQAPVLGIYDPTLPTKVTTDTFGYNIGLVLEQHDDTNWHPVEYFNQKRFHWLDIISDVNWYIQSCAVCHRNKGRHQLLYGELKPLPIPFPRDRRGHDGILTVIDRLSKYARFLPCKYHVTVPKLARLLHTGWFCSHSVPEDIVSDRDTRFMSAFWTTLMVESGTNMKSSSTRHPQMDGQTERAHQTTQMMLRTLIRPDQKDWVDRLPDIEFAYNTSVHSTIGVTPFELHHGGRKGRIFADILLSQAADIDAACSPASTRKYREMLAKDRVNMQKA